MALNPANESAYQGRGWRPRRGTFAGELEKSFWTTAVVNSEWAPLKAVALHIPGEELRSLRSPRRVQHLRRLDVDRLRVQMENIRATFERLGIEVLVTETESAAREQIPPNFMFQRDLFNVTPEGVILARMGSEIRKDEEWFAQRFAVQAGLPIRARVAGTATLEGADVLWLDPRTVLCGTGNRTNRQGLTQLKQILSTQNVRVLEIQLPKTVQHLLGLLQIVDRRRAVYRRRMASRALVQTLARAGFECLALEESDEITDKQGLNFVTVGPNQIVMASGCPSLRADFEEFNLSVRAEVDISELTHAAGGLACATGILARRKIK